MDIDTANRKLVLHNDGTLGWHIPGTDVHAPLGKYSVEERHLIKFVFETDQVSGRVILDFIASFEAITDERSFEAKPVKFVENDPDSAIEPVDDPMDANHWSVYSQDHSDQHDTYVISDHYMQEDADDSKLFAGLKNFQRFIEHRTFQPEAK